MFKIKSSIHLDDKVNEYINWYYLEYVRGIHTELGEYNIPIELKNFIEKVAVWFELRYPDLEVLKKFGEDSDKSIDDIIFNNSFSLNKTKWEDFLNAETFYKTLSLKEKSLLSCPSYPDLVYLDPDKRQAHLHLNSSGFVEIAEDFQFIKRTNLGNVGIIDESLEGRHISEVLDILKSLNVKIPRNNDIEKCINNYERNLKRYNGLLDSIMYRIIERGGNRIGPRRGYLFAKEFNRDISIPIQYGIDTTDPNLDKFIYNYLNDGGNPDIICYQGYLSKTSKYDNKIIKRNLCDFYDEEEYNNQKKLLKK